MLTNSQKEHLTYTAIGQVLALIAFGIWTSSYILPGFEKIDITLAATNASIAKFQKTEDKGLIFEEITAAIVSRTEYAELLKIMNSDVAGTTNVIAKNIESMKYLDWIRQSIGDSSNEKEAIAQYKKKLNSILPTLNPISGAVEEENIDLKTYIKFIENRIIKEFNFDSRMTLGMQGITPGQKNGDLPENLGTFEVQIAFKSTNENIAKFIQFINNSGNPELLVNTGVIANEDIPEVMSNPLITLTSFGLQEPLNENDPEGENTGRATIRFYIRGIAKDDIAYLKENIRARGEKIEENMKKTLDECKVQGALCGERKNQLDLFQRKYQEYKNGNALLLSIPNSGVDQIYTLSQTISVLKELEKELEDIKNLNI